MYASIDGSSSPKQSSTDPVPPRLLAMRPASIRPTPALTGAGRGVPLQQPGAPRMPGGRGAPLGTLGSGNLTALTPAAPLVFGPGPPSGTSHQNRLHVPTPATSSSVQSSASAASLTSSPFSATHGPLVSVVPPTDEFRRPTELGARGSRNDDSNASTTALRRDHIAGNDAFAPHQHQQRQQQRQNAPNQRAPQPQQAPPLWDTSLPPEPYDPRRPNDYETEKMRAEDAGTATNAAGAAAPAGGSGGKRSAADLTAFEVYQRRLRMSERGRRGRD